MIEAIKNGEYADYLLKKYDEEIENYTDTINKNSILSSNLKTQYQHLKDFFEVYDIKLNKISFIDTLIVTHRIIIAIEDKKKKAISKKGFINTLEQMNFILNSLNNYEKEKGYTKIQKRNELLLKEFDKYLNDEKLKNSLKSFFDDTIDIKLPTINNIISLFQHNIKTILKETSKISNDEIEEAILILSRNLFKKINFTKDLTYKRVIFGKDRLSYRQKQYIKLKENEIFILRNT